MKQVLALFATSLMTTTAVANDHSDQRYIAETSSQTQQPQIVSQAAQPSGGTHSQVFTFGLDEGHKTYLEKLEKQRDLYR